MNEKKIKLCATNEVQEFVKAASDCNFDINMHYERAIVDAKSFLGVLSLGLAKIVTVKYGGSNHTFESVLQKYVVA
ncbi:phosphocarrier protein HPr [uncultured Roseburia sp.]|uniref:HPr family phosphocarrier protein n=1 Tax=Brotonthovivens ammoniilytica TaxID=2981725 RepID=A0ABT2TMY2_9FIRM|nr:HPr family phosphocarrier protein [Brotonthovivens ammoniilytica]MCU6763021.1 HPr family phosphocarrier protein [Brotonthovivens ammoniilytica]SCJ00717.1 phosphocarrier protein HPr [uncultured Roseburia sp.]